MPASTLKVVRYERRYGGPPTEDPDPTDSRTPAQKDRDRLLYTTALRRLSGVTQVTAPADGGVIVHNRLTHSLEVAQIARRLAERLAKRQKNLCQKLGGLDPDVVEAASLAHDLGHPPFGHVVEEELKALADEQEPSVPGSFEGNAQSFRIVTKLAVHRYSIGPDNPQYPGLDLTRATLNAILKYPYLRGSGMEQRAKWGVYETERSDLTWAKTGPFDTVRQRSIEAEIMDWADDIAYSVHDLEDYYRAGQIPLDLLMQPHSKEGTAFLRRALKRKEEGKRLKDFDEAALRDTFEFFQETFPVFSPFSGTRQQRGQLRALTSTLIGRYISATSLSENPVNATGDHLRRSTAEGRPEEIEVALLKELTWDYVIERPELRRKQRRQRQIIRELFQSYRKFADIESQWPRFPSGYQERLAEMGGTRAEVGQSKTRLVIDFIASMTEPQVFQLHRQLPK